MFDPKLFDEMAQKFTENMPPQFQALKTEMEQTFKSSLQMAFAKLDLVTSEEFEIQSQVLAKTREKLETLENRVSELEHILEKQNKPE